MANDYYQEAREEREQQYRDSQRLLAERDEGHTCTWGRDAADPDSIQSATPAPAGAQLPKTCPRCGYVICETDAQKHAHAGERCLCDPAKRDAAIAKGYNVDPKSLPTMDCFNCRPRGIKDSMHKHHDGWWICETCGRRWHAHFKR